MEDMLCLLEARIAACRERAGKLEKDLRKDEAVFEKVRENVYDIFKTVLNVAGKQHGDDEEAIRSFFASRLGQIPSSWRQSLEAARQHGDTQKAWMEEIKLAVIDDITAAFEQTRRE